MARLHTLREFDIANTYWGPAVSLFFNYCPWHCKGCWNEETWKLDKSLEIPNDEVVDKIIKALDADGVHKDLTLLGGDPLADLNLEDVEYIVGKVKELRPETKVLCWTGFTWKMVKDYPIMNMIDILIDGRFVEKLKVYGKKYGSSNQKIIDVQKSLKEGKLILAPEKAEL